MPLSPQGDPVRAEILDFLTRPPLAAMGKPTPEERAAVIRRRIERSGLGDRATLEKGPVPKGGRKGG
ncbi:MAG: hypothetical protein ACFB22_12595 [Rhodothalassiaceae bacterium]